MSSISRKSHCLKREKTLAMPHHIIFFDTETEEVETSAYSVEQVLKLGWALYWRRGCGKRRDKLDAFAFTDASSFWSFISRYVKRKRKLWVIAHNIVFDFTVVKGWGHLRRAGYKLKFFHSSGTTSLISVRCKGASIIFVDSMNWFRESLAKVGERLGCPKIDVDFETCSIGELSAHCLRDVEILYRAFKDFIELLEEHLISRLCYTIGSTAMSAYLFGFYRDRIYIHNNKEVVDLERDSYRGGRVECFFLGELSNDNYYFLDVNSLYPSVMHSNPYPVKYRKKLCNPDVATVADYLNDKAVVAQVLIETDEPVYAVRRERSIYPVGRFWVTLTTPELKYALSRRHLIKVEQAVVYEQAFIFTKFVDKFYSLRLQLAKEGRDNYAEMVKLLLNSLSGKFGQKADVWEKIGDCPNEPDRVEVCFMADGGRRQQIRYLLGEIFELVGQEETFNSFPAVSSHITAYGRIELYRLMKQCGQGNYFYCDTDSLLVNEVGLCNLQNELHETTLGRLKRTEPMASVILRGLKDYSTTAKDVIKGIRKNAEKVSESEYLQELWPSFKGMLRTGDVNTYTVKKQRKVLVRKYTKGTVSATGHVSPFVLADFDEVSQSLY